MVADQMQNRSRQRQPLLLLSFLLIAAEKATCQQDANSDSFMDRAQNAVAQRTQQLTDDCAKELEKLSKLYELSGDLGAKAAANTELTRIQQTRQIPFANFNQLPAGVAALESDYKRQIREETIRVLHPLVAQRRDEIAKRKQERDFATAMIMEKELDAVCERFGWKTMSVTPNTSNIPQNPSPKYPLAARRQHLTGTGLFFLEIDTISGAVSHVTVWKSTGHAILDEAAVSAFRRWRFAPHSAVEVSVPITFSMNAKSPTPSGKR
jgi:TonB family protein